MNNAEVLAEAEAVIAGLYPPQMWDDKALRRLTIASWQQAQADHFIRLDDLRG